MAIPLTLSLMAALIQMPPWDPEFTARELWPSTRFGLLVGIFGCFTFVLSTGLLRRRSLNAIEAKETSEKVQGARSAALDNAESARASAIRGSLLVDQAYLHFTAPSYIPFWEAVKEAEGCLRNCCKALAAVQDARLKFSELLCEREHTFPDLDAEIGTLFDPRPDMLRLADVARQGDGDKDFANIRAQMEVRRSVEEVKQAVDLGFAGLNQAIRQMEENVTSAIENLRSEVVTEIRKNAAIQTKILQGVELIATKSAGADNKGSQKQAKVSV